MHRTAGAPLPELVGARKAIAGWTIQLGAAKNDPRSRPNQAAPAVPASLRLMIATLDTSTAAGARDSCLLVLGFAVAARRSELVALDLADVAETTEGLEVTVYRGKNKKRQQVAVPYGAVPATCPVRTFQRWRDLLAEHGQVKGPLFVRIDTTGRCSRPYVRCGAVVDVVTDERLAQLS